jgi:hypothetical protein
MSIFNKVRSVVAVNKVLVGLTAGAALTVGLGFAGAEKAFAGDCASGTTCNPPQVIIPPGGNTQNDTNNQFDNNANADNNNNLAGTINNVNVNNVGNSTFKFDGLECPTPNLSASVFGGYSDASTGRSNSNAFNIGASASLSAPVGGKVGKSCSEAFAAKTEIQVESVKTKKLDTSTNMSKYCIEQVRSGITYFPVEVLGEELATACTGYVGNVGVIQIPAKPPEATPPAEKPPAAEKPPVGKTTPSPTTF